MKKERPIFLNLWQIRFPLTAIASILHRVSGVLLFVLLPWLLYVWSASLVSEPSHAALLQAFSHQFLPKFLAWLLLSSLSYHMLAGLRHLLMDWGLAVHFSSAQVTAAVTLLASVVLAGVWGVWLWL